MATSSSSNFELDVASYVEEAFERLGQQDVTGYQLKTSRRSLNIMLQEWGNRGIHYWEVSETDIDLIEGQSEYIFFRSTGDGTSAVTIPANTYGVADVLEATIRTNRTAVNQSDAALTKIARATYSALSSKLSKGTPAQYFVQRFIVKTTFTIYPTPDSTNADKVINFFYIK